MASDGGEGLGGRGIEAMPNSADASSHRHERQAPFTGLTIPPPAHPESWLPLLVSGLLLSWQPLRRRRSSFGRQNDIHLPRFQCDINTPCKVSCCSSSGVCGFTMDHCGDGYVSNRNSIAECGQYAQVESFHCPINVCCSYDFSSTLCYIVP